MDRTSRQRTQRYRNRQQRGVVVIAIEISSDDLQAMVRHGMPDEPHLSRCVIADYMTRLLRAALKSCVTRDAERMKSRVSCEEAKTRINSKEGLSA